MAIAFVSAGAVTRGDVYSTGSPATVATPPGFAATNLLILTVVTDDISGVSTPAGWQRLLLLKDTPNGNLATQTPPYAPPRMAFFWKIASGSEGATVSISFSTATWPTGSPYYIAAMLAYSGTDLSNPLEAGTQNWNTGNSTTLTHGAVTTVNANDWLLTFRYSSAAGALSFTNSVGTDAERIDTTDGFSELGMALYDSNGPLAAGVQTTRVTTSNIAPAAGSIGVCIAFKAPTVATTAQAQDAGGVGTAYNVSAVMVPGPWDTCSAMPVYSFYVDWNGDGDFADAGENITKDILTGGISISYGRDQIRQLSPPKTGTASLMLDNSRRTYSPENTASPLFGNLDPARNMMGQVIFGADTIALGRMRIDDYNVTADMNDRSLSLTFLDGMKSLDGKKLYTQVLSGQRTGYLINYILDQAGWTGPRDLDPGVTVVPWWWLDGTDSLTAVLDLLKSEGPPSVAYVALDGTFVFRDRHHRILRQESLFPQAVFNQNDLDPCTPPAVTGLSFTAPFTYAHGWRNIINSVSFTVPVRTDVAVYSQVWSSGSAFTLGIGQSVTITAAASDPFLDAQIPAAGIDYTTSGVGTLQISLSRTSGQSTDITILAVGGSVTVNDLQLQARTIPVASTQTVSRMDTTSINDHGEQSYPDPAPWAGVEDAYAIAGSILLHYAQRRPTVQLRVAARNPEHLHQILTRKVGDRVHITYGEMRLDDDFFIETITHSIDRMNDETGLPPVHSAVFGCEKNLGASNPNPFRFDVRGAGFDQGIFDPLAGDNPASVFVFDDPRGTFDFGIFGT